MQKVMRSFKGLLRYHFVRTRPSLELRYVDGEPVSEEIRQWINSIRKIGETIEEPSEDRLHHAEEQLEKLAAHLRARSADKPS
jgi:hypothetical protein